MNVLRLALSLSLLPPRLHSKQVLQDDRWDENEDGVGHKEQGAEHVVEPEKVRAVELEDAEDDKGEVVEDHEQREGRDGGHEEAPNR